MGWSRKRVGPLQELDPCLLGNRIRNEIHSNLQKEGKKERNKPGLPLWLRYKASAYNVGDLGSIPGLGRPPEEGNGNPLQYSGLENPMDGRISQATVHGVAELDTTERLHFLYFLCQALQGPSTHSFPRTTLSDGWRLLSSSDSPAPSSGPAEAASHDGDTE